MYRVDLVNDDKLLNLTDIFLNAYPGIKMKSDDYKKALIERNKSEFINFYGVYDLDKAVGAMRIHDFKMNLLNEMVKATGVGNIAVHLCNKKENVAKEIMKFFLYKAREEKASIALLYAFSPEFYKNMGFGFGTFMNQFKIHPKNIKALSKKDHIKVLNIENSKMLYEFYKEKVKNTNGLIEKTEDEIKSLLENTSNKVFGFVKDEKIMGYIISQFKIGREDSFLINDMIISEILFDGPDVFLEFASFLKSQNDQFRYVIINISDENLIYALKDPRDYSNDLLTSVYHKSSSRGMGIMYRVTDVEELFISLKDHDFNGENLNLKLNIVDTFIEENNRSFMIKFVNGKAFCSSLENYDVELTMDIADFSSIITCAVNLKSLYKYGLVKISDEGYLQKLDVIFSTAEKPLCFTNF